MCLFLAGYCNLWPEILSSSSPQKYTHIHMKSILCLNLCNTSLGNNTLKDLVMDTVCPCFLLLYITKWGIPKTCWDEGNRGKFPGNDTQSRSGTHFQPWSFMPQTGPLYFTKNVIKTLVYKSAIVPCSLQPCNSVHFL